VDFPTRWFTRHTHIPYTTHYTHYTFTLRFDLPTLPWVYIHTTTHVLVYTHLWTFCPTLHTSLVGFLPSSSLVAGHSSTHFGHLATPHTHTLYTFGWFTPHHCTHHLHIHTHLHIFPCLASLVSPTLFSLTHTTRLVLVSALFTFLLPRAQFAYTHTHFLYTPHTIHGSLPHAWFSVLSGTNLAAGPDCLYHAHTFGFTATDTTWLLVFFRFTTHAYGFTACRFTGFTHTVAALPRWTVTTDYGSHTGIRTFRFCAPRIYGSSDAFTTHILPAHTALHIHLTLPFACSAHLLVYFTLRTILHTFTGLPLWLHTFVAGLYTHAPRLFAYTPCAWDTHTSTTRVGSHYTPLVLHTHTCATLPLVVSCTHTMNSSYFTPRFHGQVRSSSLRLVASLFYGLLPTAHVWSLHTPSHILPDYSVYPPGRDLQLVPTFHHRTYVLLDVLSFVLHLNFLSPITVSSFGCPPHTCGYMTFILVRSHTLPFLHVIYLWFWLPLFICLV